MSETTASPRVTPIAQREANRPRWFWPSVATGLYAVAAILLFHPLSPVANDYLSRAGIGDPAQMVWFLSYTPHAISHGLNLFSTNLIDYPTGADLASNTSVPLLGFIAWPITATLGPVAAFNLLVRLGIFLSATSMFFVLHRWVDSRLACFIGGLCFGFGPYIIGQAIFNTHINLLFVPLFPILMLLIDELFVRQHWPWKIAAILLGLTSSAEMLIAPELLSDFGIVTFVIVLYLLIRHPHLAREKFAYILRSLAGAVVLFGLICGYLIRGMVSGPNHIRGAVYSIGHLQSFRNSVVETFLPTLQQLVTTTKLSRSLHLSTRDLNELGGYLSIPLVVFVVVTIIVWRRRYGIIPIAIGTFVAFVLSTGESLHIGSTNIALPEALLTHLPLLKSTIPDRFALETLLGMCALFAIGIDRSLVAIARQSSPSRTYRYVGLTALVLIVIAALMPRTPIREQKLIWPTTIGTEIASHVAKHAVVLTYPYPSPPLNQAMAWQAESGFAFSLLGGYATVPQKNGEGQEWPRLQTPVEVQSYLTELELGKHSHYPRIKPPTNSTSLCTYVKRYGVTDIVIMHHIVHFQQATSYLSSIPSVVTFNDSDVTIYRVDKSIGTTSNRC